MRKNNLEIQNLAGKGQQLDGILGPLGILIIN